MVIKNLQMKNARKPVTIDHLPFWFDDHETLEYVCFSQYEGWEVYAIEDPSSVGSFLVLLRSPWFSTLASHGFIDRPSSVGDHLHEFLDQGEFVESADGSYFRKVIRNGKVHVDRFSAENGLEGGSEEDFNDLPVLFPQVVERGVPSIPNYQLVAL